MLKVACGQLASEPGKCLVNLDKAGWMIRQAKVAGAELVVFPELFNVGYDFDVIKGMHYDFAETEAVLSRTARDKGIYLACGVLEVVDEVWYNSLIVWDKYGERAATYRKISLFPLSKEETVFTAGSNITTVNVGDFKLGLMICFDIRFPEISRRYMEEGCDGIIVASAFPFPRLDHWRTLLKSRAIENQMYIVAANRTGKDGELQFLGNSCIIDPWGTVKATASETDEGVIFHDLQLEKNAEVRKAIPCKQNVAWLRQIGK